MTDDPIEAAILSLLAERPANATLSPEEAARAIAGADAWHGSLTAVRRAAVRLALAGRLVIYRKGKPVDPSDFKGVYRLGLPRLD